MKRNIVHILLLCSAAAALAACSTTKRLGSNDVLYTGVKKIEVEAMNGEDVPGSVESAVKEPLSVKPNNPLYSPYVRTPFPIGLWAWNHLYSERKTGFKAWLYRNLAKEPVLVENVQPELRMRLVEDILDNHGYFGSEATFEVIPKKNPKKARINYRVDVAEPWTYSNVAFPEIQGPVTRAIDTMKHSSNVVPGAQYNIDTLTRERIRITNKLREESYYYFRPDYLEYLADTTQEHLKVDLRMVMAQGIPTAAVQPYEIGDISVSFLGSETGGGRPDTMSYNGIKIRYQPPLKIRPKILARALTIQPGQPSRVSEINRTLNNLTQLGIFRYVNMEVTPLDSLKPGDRMDMNITAAFDQSLQADLEVDFTHKSSSYIGPGATFTVKNKNIFHGGEVLSVRLNGAYEWQTGNRPSDEGGAINSYELGLNTSLMFPRLVAPGFIPRGRYGARTTYNIGASLLNRPKYFTMASFNNSISYDFRTSPGSSHNLTLLRFVYNKTLRTTAQFKQLEQSQPALFQSFKDQLIPSASYTYTWNQAVGKNRQDMIVWSSTASTAGNIFSGIWSLAGQKRPYKVFGNAFAQFVKLTSEIKYYKKIGESNTLALRAFAGAGHPYGNDKVMPYTEQFYIGGANSIRAFTIRSIGPGRYHPTEKSNNFDRVADAKLEANLEFRFGIVGGLKGAVFLDAGNIWMLRDTYDPNVIIDNGNNQWSAAELEQKIKDEQEKRKRESDEKMLNGRRFFKDIAVGTGVGVRYDLSFLVVRFDVGVGIHLPYDTGKSGYYNIPKFKDGMGYHLAIGYPF